MSRILTVVFLAAVSSASVAGQVRNRTQSIESAILWLRGQQKPDGSFRADGESPLGPVGLTSLAVLTMLGDGSTMRAGPHKTSLKRGVVFLRREQLRRKGGAFIDVQGPAATEHMLASLAVAEAHGLSQYKLLRKNAIAAAEHVTTLQHVDLTSLAWELLLQRALRNFGLPDLAPHLEKFGAQRVLGKRAKSDAKKARGRFDSTELKMPIRLLWRAMAPGAKPVFEGKPTPDTGVLLASAGQSLPQRDPMFWYLGTLAMLTQGGPDAKLWQDMVTRAIAKARRDDGSWDGTGSDSGLRGRIYTTALFTLIQQATWSGRIPKPQRKKVKGRKRD